MKRYSCRRCGAALFFENSICVTCGSAVAFSRAEREIVPVDDGSYVDADGLIWHVCENLGLSGCTWLAEVAGGQCFACDLTRTRPADDDETGIAQLVDAERAKRQLVAELDTLGFPLVGKRDDPLNGLAFDLLSSADEQVLIAHADGIVTIDLAESDDVHREKVRDQLDEPYRTMLGHLRHEVGHYYEWQLVELVGGGLLDRARTLFGDETSSYQDAVARHYDDGPPPGWEETFVSSYATMHPYEDFAETWAHHLHIQDAVETAVAYGLLPAREVRSRDSFRDLVSRDWIPLATALNMVNRSMGLHDLYPFVLSGPILDKLEFVAALRPV
ncbi:zinc-binding metallopeptidase family protein [Gordonia sp. (in: high G+C Gram-positive bacteria)]|uniref:zinc-binding metallopeptidase family protein n=1 Tax=unclassified Gordonia (in: high G+C Gram-positive bacteria) TaxID=2657482 RepID=UPI0026018567|nr:putative zinc-binding metallopeptidase [Gordonia sp. (in: high G+C Gram-positive bacteria)]